MTFSKIYPHSYKMCRFANFFALRICRSNDRFFGIISLGIANDTILRILRSNDTFSNVTFFRRDLRESQANASLCIGVEYHTFGFGSMQCLYLLSLCLRMVPGIAIYWQTQLLSRAKKDWILGTHYFGFMVLLVSYVTLPPLKIPAISRFWPAMLVCRLFIVASI